MKRLVDVVLPGTARAGAVIDDPYAARLDAIDATVERRILLVAGAQAVRRAAGARAVRLPPAEAAPPDRRAACSPRVAAILAEMLDGAHAELLPEALARLDRANVRLPHALLPKALAATAPALRMRLYPLLDARGAWLAQHDPRGAWVLAMGPRPESALEAAWTEGTSAERRAALATLRRVNPAAARAWVASTWGTDGADARAAFLEALREGTGEDDEPLLERARTDRSAGVRAVAQSLLARIPTSAFVARMQARGDAMLGPSGTTLTVAPAEFAGEEAEHDGLGKPPPGVGAKAFGIVRVLAAIPPSHWTARFGAAPDAIVRAAASSEWAAPLAEGWTLAAIAHGAVEWLRALFRFWQSAAEPLVPEATAGRFLTAILRAFPAGAADDLAVEVLERDAPPGVVVTLDALAAPWSARFADVYLAAVRRFVRAPGNVDPAWFGTLRRAAHALPEAALATAIDAIAGASAAPFDRLLDDVEETLRLRLILHREIAS